MAPGRGLLVEPEGPDALELGRGSATDRAGGYQAWRAIRAPAGGTSPLGHAADQPAKSPMDAITDMYDLLAPDRAAELRRHNLERLAELEARGAERRERLAEVLGDALPSARLK